MSTPPSVPGPLRPKSGGTVGGGGTTEQTANPLAKDLMSLLNPSSGPAISAGDLAGLTPQDIASAIGIGQQQDQMGQESINSLINNLYKGKLMEQIDASINAPPKDERTAAVKNYEYAQKQGYKGNFADFQKDLKTSHIKDYEYAKNNGYEGTFDEWVREMAQAGAMNLGEFIKRKNVTEDIQAQKYFTDPKGLVADVDKYIASDTARRDLAQYEPGSREREIATVRAKENYIKGKITSSGGKIVDERLDGRTFVFKVKWPNGNTTEVRYAN